VHFFFGTLWQAPLVLVVLVTFACGLSMGVLVMMPRWWKKRKTALPHAPGASPQDARHNAATLHHGI
jgi:hypothetical protein